MTEPPVVQDELSILSQEQLEFARRRLRRRKDAGLMDRRRADERIRMINDELSRRLPSRVRPYVKEIK